MGDAYALIAGGYDRVMEPLNAPLRRIALALRPVQPGETGLDVGCGHTAFSDDTRLQAYP